MSKTHVESNVEKLRQEIVEWKARASAAGNAALLQNLVDQERALQTLENETVEPARLAVAGNFASGKTRLLEGWMGCGGLLPVAENPTTGNIVEFHLQRCSEIQETRLRDWRVRIVDSNSANLILGKLLATGAALIQHEWQDGLSLLQRAQDEKSPTRWIDATNWALKAHAPEHTEKLQAVAFEVYRFARVYEQARKLAGKVLVASAAHAERLMTLEFDPQEFYSGNLRDLRLSLPEVTDDFSFGALTDEQVAALFPVIGKIMVNVDLPDDVADCISTNPVINRKIVDCPGAGADGTSVRDETLCSVELQEVDGVVALIDARNPGDSRDFINDVKRIWGVEGKKRVLAVISRFDQMPVSNGDQQKLSELARGTGPLSLDELRTACGKTLFVLLAAARQTVLDGDIDRIALVSAMAYIDAARMNGVNLGTAEFLSGQVDSSGHPWIVTCKLWQAIAERLRLGASTDEERAVARLLLDFAQAGGCHRLLSIVDEHMDGDGRDNNENRLADEWQKFKRLQEELRKLVAELPEVTATDDDDADDNSYAAAAQAVAHVYHGVGSAIAKAPPELTVRPKGQQTPVAVGRVLRREAIGQVFDWSCWRDTLNMIDPDREPNMIPIVPAEEAAGGTEPDSSESETSASEGSTSDLLTASQRELRRRRQIPICSEDFEKPFLETCEKLDGILYSTLKAVLTSTIDNIRDRVCEQLGDSQDQLLKRLIAASSDEAFLERLGPDRDRFCLAVELATDENRLFEDIESAVNVVIDQTSHLADGFFPLQRTRDGSRAVTYPWYGPVNERFGRTFEPRHRHLMRLFRLRNALVDATVFYLNSALHQLQNELHRVVKDRLEFIELEFETAARLESNTGTMSDIADSLVNELF